ncbi:uncharacterized protein LOC143446242 [Clavelina lepadiformis]|uniref:Protein phosphatase 1 regulatory subunit 37 n=1 Tax=Clavelina lepadiformis TaxID=159417 RepID=A0ABP0GTX7_CLALP
MDRGESENDASSKAMTLNSPEVITSKNHSFLPNDPQDIVPDMSTSFKRDGISSILSREYKMKNASRRVSFPEDDKIISGYGEPRNPWAHAKSTSTEELIQAYTQSCQQWGVKPITKLLVQLQEIRDFSVRAHSLTLKGEKLDSKVVETLEAVFRRVQFVIMDLEATNLDDDSAAALFDMIEYYESAVNVLVGFNKNLGTRGWQAAAHMMRKMSCLRLFDGHGVPLTDQAVPFVGRALRLSNTVVTLHLECATLSGRPMLLIVAALRMNVTLRELFLADNRLISTDALQLANLLKFNSVLQLLDVRNNHIQDAGLCHICAGLMSQSQTNPGGLQTLVLWNNQLSYQSMGKLAMALKYTNTLSTLNLGQNVLGDDGAAKLKEGLLHNHSLLRLGMVGTKLSCEGAIALAEFLAETPRIIRLDMRNNDIQVGGLMALSLAFKINYSLLRLDIDKPSSKEVLKELVEKQDSLLKDIHAYAARNKEQALQRVLNVQMERQKKTDEEKTHGFRYMDMTNSAIASSQNNSNNKTNVATNSKQVCNSQLLECHIDDSPMNSPALLPTNSVSYHQVSPVMFSSSEMEKRAAQTKSDADATTQQEDVEERLVDGGVHQNKAQSQLPSSGESQHKEDEPAIDPQSSEVDTEVMTPSKNQPIIATEEDEKLDEVAKSSLENIKPSIDEDSTTGSEVEENTETLARSEAIDADCSSSDKTETVAGLQESNVTITHFDLSLFPKD